MTSHRYFTFTAGGLLLGVEIERVQEVVRGLEVTPVPWSADAILGVGNLRGGILTTVDVIQRLGAHHSQSASRHLNVVLTVNSERVSFVIDHEGEVVELNEQQRDAVPDTVDAGIKEYVSGAYQTDEGLLLILDTDNVFALETR